MDRIWAQILNGIVSNTIVMNDITQAPAQTMGFDSLVEITNLLDVNGNSIGIGWTTPDGVNFTPPVQQGA